MPENATALSAPLSSQTRTLPCPVPRVLPGQRFEIRGMEISADALALAGYFTAHRAHMALLAVICATAADAHRLQTEITYFAPELRVRLFPDWETLPYDAFSPHQDLVSQRLATLHDLSEGRCEILLIPAMTALYRLPPRSFMAAYTFEFTQAQKLDAAQLKAQLVLGGYEHVSQVVRPGEYSIRGGLIDLFPMGSALPYRIDLFDDEVDSIRAFDPDTQRSLHSVPEVRLLPGREFPFDAAARQGFRTRWRSTFAGDPSRISIYQNVSEGVPCAGIEYYLPLFFDDTATLFDYLPTGKKPAQLAFTGDLHQAIERFSADTKQRHAFLSHHPERPILPPDRLFLSVDDFFTQAKPFARLILSSKNISASQATSQIATEDKTLLSPKSSENFEPIDKAKNDAEYSWSLPLPKLTLNRHADHPLEALTQYLKTPAQRIFLAAESAGRRETLWQLLNENALKPVLIDNFSDFLHSDVPFALGIAPLMAGFVLPAQALTASQDGAQTHRLVLLTENELYGPSTRRSKRRQERTSDIDSMVRDLSELKINDPIVHSQHGIGRYRGLMTMDLGAGETEFLHLEYANDSKLYVPIDQLLMISRYSGADLDSAPLHTLGSGQWEKARKRAASQVHDTAAELLDLYARRAARTGYAFTLESRDYEQFSEDFGFEETPDQGAAITAVLADMTSGRPMDRLICGDVGFGKTEVALRAAFIAVQNGRQVAVLAPTTLLAEQHFQTFSDRFAAWPVRIAGLSRFKSSKDIADSIKEIKAGTIDIAIGTHKLLSSDIQFKQLGLVIIDEEHRFGVRQKEALKALRAEVDILTLTATPIPRTLSMALDGLRDFSVIATAPQKRLSIKTFVRREDKSLIREAILRELKRGGQVFFLHNSVDSIEERKAALAGLVPEARIAVAHGQMHERELEQVMRDFIAQRTHVLLCTTIIETGIDVPNANTILIQRADTFGLAQLHQLRGRVGRSHHQAYAYLLVNDPDNLTKQAMLRLQAIEQMEELGSGFYLAMHDLEIRGAGHMLGDKQSGEMQAIGFQLYTEMLSEAVKALQNGEEIDLNAPLHVTTEIKLHVSAILPSDYCADIQERLFLYKRLASCETSEDLTQIQEELIDRFGKLPPAAKALLETHRLRIAAMPLGINKIDATHTAVILQFKAKTPLDPIDFLRVVQQHPHCKIIGQDKIRIEIPSTATEGEDAENLVDTTDLAPRLTALKTILQALQATLKPIKHKQLKK